MTPEHPTSEALRAVHDRQEAFHDRIVAMGELACDPEGEPLPEDETTTNGWRAEQI